MGDLRDDVSLPRLQKLGIFLGVFVEKEFFGKFAAKEREDQLAVKGHKDKLQRYFFEVVVVDFVNGRGERACHDFFLFRHVVLVCRQGFPEVSGKRPRHVFATEPVRIPYRYVDCSAERRNQLYA